MTVSQRAQMTNISSIKQLLGPLQHLAAHLEHSAGPTSVEFRLQFACVAVSGEPIAQ